MSDRIGGTPIDATNAVAIVPGNGIVVHRKPLTVVVAAGDDAVAVAPRITALVDELVDAGAVDFGPVAERLQDFVVNYQPLGVAAVLDISPDPIAFLFDQAAAVDGDETHRGEGRSGWTTVFVNADTVVLIVGADDESSSTLAWSSLWAGTVPGRGANVSLTRAVDPAAQAPAEVPAPPPPPPSDHLPPAALAGPEPWGQPAAEPEARPENDEPPPPPGPDPSSLFHHPVPEGQPVAVEPLAGSDVGLGGQVVPDPAPVDSAFSAPSSFDSPTTEADEPVAGTPPLPGQPITGNPPTPSGPIAGTPPLPGQPPPPSGQPIAGTPPLPDHTPEAAEPSVLSGSPPLPDDPEPSGTPLAGQPPMPGDGPLAGTPPMPGDGPLAGTPPMPGDGPLAGTPPMPGDAPLAGTPPMPGDAPLAGQPPMPGTALHQEPRLADSAPHERGVEEDAIDAAKPSGQA